MIGDLTPWALYAISLIHDFQIQPDAAWNMTVPEYWALFLYKHNSASLRQQKTTMDRGQAENLKDRLRQKGFAV